MGMKDNMLSEQMIEEFQKIYFITFGKKLTYEEAINQASQLIRLYKIVLEYPLNERKYSKYLN